jgi:hypothetical protein
MRNLDLRQEITAILKLPSGALRWERIPLSKRIPRFTLTSTMIPVG